MTEDADAPNNNERDREAIDCMRIIRGDFMNYQSNFSFKMAFVKYISDDAMLKLMREYINDYRNNHRIFIYFICDQFGFDREIGMQIYSDNKQVVMDLIRKIIEEEG